MKRLITLLLVQMTCKHQPWGQPQAQPQAPAQAPDHLDLLLDKLDHLKDLKKSCKCHWMSIVPTQKVSSPTSKRKSLLSLLKSKI